MLKVIFINNNLDLAVRRDSVDITNNRNDRFSIDEPKQYNSSSMINNPNSSQNFSTIGDTQLGGEIYRKIRSEYSELFNKDDCILQIVDEKEEDPDYEIKKTVRYEGELFSIIVDKKGDSQPDENLSKKYDQVKIKRFYLAIIDTNIYYYTSPIDSKSDYFNSHYIGGCFIKENKPERFSSKEYYSFTIKFPDNKRRQYYSMSKSEIIEWIKNLRDATGYKNFFDYYRLDKTVGEGQFGLVKLGFNKKTEKKVAIKILEKDNIKTKDDWDLIKTEIDILKLSKHHNIIKFLDHYENSDYIFLVMEYLNYGNLQSYLKKNNFSLSEQEVAIIAYQMADALKYLHGFGVIHRDFKPENIMLRKSNKDEQIELKLMDFGLSKIIGNKEKALEGYGTMAFVAPEVVAKKPYNVNIDVWSLGITIYYMLSGEIPFLAKDKSESTAELILNKDLVFSSTFNKLSQEVVDLISLCLNKNPDQRISIKEVLDHKWFKTQIFK